MGGPFSPLWITLIIDRMKPAFTEDLLKAAETQVIHS